MVTALDAPSRPRYTDEWYTPPEVSAEFLVAMGQAKFDLDPASPLAGPTVAASRHFTRDDDGLAQPWNGVIYLNPPYSSKQVWLEKAISEVDAGRCQAVLVLLPAATENRWFHRYVLPRPRWVSRGRLPFDGPHSNKDKRTSRGSVLLLLSRDWNFAERLRRGLEGSRWAFCGYPPQHEWGASSTESLALQIAKDDTCLADCNETIRRVKIRIALREIQQEIDSRGSYTSPLTGRTITRLGNPSEAPAQHLAEFAGSDAAAAAKRRQADEFAAALSPVLVEILGQEPWGQIPYGAVAAELDRRGIPTARPGGTWHRATIRRLIDRIRRLGAGARSPGDDASSEPAVGESPSGN